VDLTREDITFTSGGRQCAAWLYLPDGAHEPLPCVVMAHGFVNHKNSKPHLQELSLIQQLIPESVFL
jgi:cephalosporin-C deacetylase-like acetyl esterase